MAKRRKGSAEPMEATAEKLRPVRLEVSEDLHKWIRREAAERDASLGETVRQVLSEVLGKKWGGAK